MFYHQYIHPLTLALQNYGNGQKGKSTLKEIWLYWDKNDGERDFLHTLLDIVANTEKKDPQQIRMEHQNRGRAIQKIETLIQTWIEQEHFKEEWHSLSFKEQDFLLCLSCDSYVHIRSQIALSALYYRFIDIFNKTDLTQCANLDLKEKFLTSVFGQDEQSLRDSLQINFPHLHLEGEINLNDLFYLAFVDQFSSEKKLMLQIDKDYPVSLQALLTSLPYFTTNANSFWDIGMHYFLVAQFYQKMETDLDRQIKSIAFERQLKNSLPINRTDTVLHKI